MRASVKRRTIILFALFLLSLVASCDTNTTPDSSSTCGPFANCTALKQVYPSGVMRGHCAYQSRLDRDNDGHACE